MTRSESIPSWRSAWLLDNQEWVRARKQSWKRIKNSIPIVESRFRKDELKKIQNFYLTGSAFIPELPPEDWRWECYHPDTSPLPVSNPMLLELWLTADSSKENWQHIYEKYTEGDRRNARNHFRDLIYRFYPEYGSIFDGLEERLYRLLEPIRCRPEDYPDIKPEVFDKVSGMEHVHFLTSIRSCLVGVSYKSIAPIFAKEWCDTIPGAYNYKQALAFEFNDMEPVETYIKSIEDTLIRCFQIIEKPDQYNAEQVLLAKNIINNLSGMEFPPGLNEVLSNNLKS